MSEPRERLTDKELALLEHEAAREMGISERILYKRELLSLLAEIREHREHEGQTTTAFAVAQEQIASLRAELEAARALVEKQRAQLATDAEIIDGMGIQMIGMSEELGAEARGVGNPDAPYSAARSAPSKETEQRSVEALPTIGSSIAEGESHVQRITILALQRTLAQQQAVVEAAEPILKRLLAMYEAVDRDDIGPDTEDKVIDELLGAEMEADVRVVAAALAALRASPPEKGTSNDG